MRARVYPCRHVVIDPSTKRVLRSTWCSLWRIDIGGAWAGSAPTLPLAMDKARAVLRDEFPADVLAAALLDSGVIAAPSSRKAGAA
jgi:hypothetical protein